MWAILSKKAFQKEPVVLSQTTQRRLLEKGVYSQCLAALTEEPCQNYLNGWSEWKVCMTDHLQTMRRQNDSALADFIFRCKGYLPWMKGSNHTAVLLEFRAMEHNLKFSVANVMDNLPIHWRIQIVGGPEMMQLALELYSPEIAAEKILLLYQGYQHVRQASEEGHIPYRVEYPPADISFLPRRKR